MDTDDDVTTGIVGAFGKASCRNITLQDTVTIKGISISRKQVLDDGVVSGKLGFQRKTGNIFGLAKGAKASAWSGRDTICIEGDACQIEIGASVNAVSIGYDPETGLFIEGYGVDSNGGQGVFSWAPIFRITPKG